MGDRGNIAVQQERSDNKIYLYTHWSGHAIPSTLAAALRRGESRWDDPSYLTRIIFDEMTRGESKDETTGFGISTTIGDNSYPIPVVKTEDETVAYDGATYSFNAFIEAFKNPQEDTNG